MLQHSFMGTNNKTLLEKHLNSSPKFQLCICMAPCITPIRHNFAYSRMNTKRIMWHVGKLQEVACPWILYNLKVVFPVNLQSCGSLLSKEAAVPISVILRCHKEEPAAGPLNRDNGSLTSVCHGVSHRLPHIQNSRLCKGYFADIRDEWRDDHVFVVQR